jgi:plastocyanin
MRTAALVLFAAAGFQQTAAELIRVMVGADANGQPATVFTPNQVQANVGDVIQFEFRAKNHSVTQSSFAEPCARQFNTVTQLPGIDSGFFPVSATDSASGLFPAFQMEIKQSNSPIWMFCNQAQHCKGGMVFAVNAPQTGDKTFDNWTKLVPQANHPDPALNQLANFTPANTENVQSQFNGGVNSGGGNTALRTSFVGGASATRTSNVLSTAGVNNVPLNLGPGVTGAFSVSTLLPNTIAANLPTGVQIASSASSTKPAIWLALAMGLVGAIIA